jgi:hypothetical protein
MVGTQRSCGCLKRRTTMVDLTLMMIGCVTILAIAYMATSNGRY